jgi:hypothetical protein
MSYIDRLDRDGRAAGSNDSYQIIGYQCTIRTAVVDKNDTVTVTLDGDEGSQRPMPVEWRPRISDSGALARVYPQRGMKGTVIFRDVGRPWLLW